MIVTRDATARNPSAPDAWGTTSPTCANWWKRRTLVVVKISPLFSAMVRMTRFAPLLALLFALPLGAQRTNRDPDAVRLVTDDIAHFWDAFDARAVLGTERALDSLYFGRATPGLQDFQQLRLQRKDTFAKTVDVAARYYGSTRASMARIPTFEPSLRDMLRRFAALYPDATFPDVYFVVGRLSTGGTTGSAGLLIGAEMYGRTDDSLLTAPLGNWHRAVLRPVDDLTVIVAHELVHYQQGQLGSSLLGRSLREGIADFVAELLTGQNLNAGAVDYLDAHEAELRAEFLAGMTKDDVSQWLYNGDASVGRPADLGYAVGHHIARAYYERQADKRTAVREMLTLSNEDAARRFLDASGWAH